MEAAYLLAEQGGRVRFSVGAINVGLILLDYCAVGTPPPERRRSFAHCWSIYDQVFDEIESDQDSRHLVLKNAASI